MFLKYDCNNYCNERDYIYFIIKNLIEFWFIITAFCYFQLLQSTSVFA